MDCSPPGSSVHGILQARILGWVAISLSRGSSQLNPRTELLNCRRILHRYTTGDALTAPHPNKKKKQTIRPQTTKYINRLIKL